MDHSGFGESNEGPYSNERYTNGNNNGYSVFDEFLNTESIGADVVGSSSNNSNASLSLSTGATPGVDSFWIQPPDANSPFQHHRSGSAHSDAPSIMPSPHLSAAASPYHSALSSPYLAPATTVPPQQPGAAELVQLANDFSIVDRSAAPESPLYLDDFSLSAAEQQHQQGQPHAPQMTPEINVDFVPQAQFDTPQIASYGTIAPPINGRQRSQSDSDLRPVAPPGYYPPHSGAAHTAVPPMSPAQPHSPTAGDFLSPESAVETRRSRSVSTSAKSMPNSRQSSRSRSRSASRDYILELATPSQSTKRVQKHPSSFACHLCDKRFTRAYNLRSHLRTHTDERPFVCTVCGKAFARQHDRKRHEALHSGEKKFECKGVLSDGKTVWGCGRKFARADALGRHFRTEAGRLCIKPLLEEEERERRKREKEQQPQLYVDAYGQQQAPGGVPIYLSGEGTTPSLMLSPPSNNAQVQQPPPVPPPPPPSQNYVFPTALLQQFPSLMYEGMLSGSDLSEDEQK
ncbi:hypothetical protein TRVA0_007S04038 [Trichomonascus vanleenenianus]|uniref:DNA-binding transcription factor CRZ1 n=1 Tax=Trichomonascus vanleenenianus TaxID=2268995 RepID=UPI003ECBAD33